MHFGRCALLGFDFGDDFDSLRVVVFFFVVGRCAPLPLCFDFDRLRVAFVNDEGDDPPLPLFEAVETGIASAPVDGISRWIPWGGTEGRPFLASTAPWDGAMGALFVPWDGAMEGPSVPWDGSTNFGVSVPWDGAMEPLGATLL